MSLLLDSPDAFPRHGSDLVAGDRIRTALGWSSPIAYFTEVPADALYFGHPGGRVPHLAPGIPMRTVGVIVADDVFVVVRPSFVKAA